MEVQTVVSLWLKAITDIVKLYLDFSGYTDMAIGLGLMIGIKIMENFDYPLSTYSVTSFWRKWHISLSSWFKDYIYIPLGGNRKGKFRKYFNIFVVWFLTGLWHGASWNFIIWGLYFGVLLLIEKFWLKKYIEKLPNILRIIYTDFLVLISWAIFAFDNFKQLGNWFSKMFGIGTSFTSSETLYYLKNYAIMLVICVIGCTPVMKILYEKLNKKFENNKSMSIIFDTICLVICIGIFILSIAYLVNSSYNPFLYFRF